MKSLRSFSDRNFFLGVAAIIFLIRTFMVLFEVWPINDGGDVPESLISGNLAFDILNGSWRGWKAYLYNTYGNLGNEVLLGILAVPFFFLFGSSLFVVQLVPTVMAILFAWLIFRFATDYISPAVGRTAMLLFAFAPFVVQSWAALPYFGQFESGMFSIAAMLLFMRMIDQEELRRKLYYAGALGLVSGLGWFQSEVFLFTLGIIAIAWVIRDRLFFRSRAFWLAVVGLMIGLTPYFFFGFDYFLEFVEVSLRGRIGAANHGLNFSSLWMGVPFTVISATLLSPFSGLGRIVGVDPALVGYCSCGLLLLSVLVFRRAIFANTALSMATAHLFLFLAVLLKSKAMMFYYALPAYFSAVIVLAAVFCFARKSCENLGGLAARRIPVFLLVAAMGINVYEIGIRGNYDHISATIQQKFVTRGYCFFWPRGYSAPSGYKTVAGQKVESQLRFVRFSIQKDLKQKNSFSKTILLAHGSYGVPVLGGKMVPLAHGMDLTFQGLAATSSKIQEKLQGEEQRLAFESAAVVYGNDFLLSDIIADLKKEKIDREIPEPYRQFFYREIGRKLKDRATRYGEVATLVPPAAREFLRDGFENARLYGLKTQELPRVSYKTRLLTIIGLRESTRRDPWAKTL